jgi:catechol 1,2-dioxygenase/hydroxyquinol 1,2-dioxygenase
MRELTPETITDGVLDMRLSRESAADKASGRVGADPSAIMKKSAQNEIVPAGAG